jgi:multidrug efflux pump
LALATGAGSGAQRAIGTGVVGGMLTGTFLGIFFVPLFFVVVLRLVLKERRHHIHHDEPALEGGSANG